MAKKTGKTKKRKIEVPYTSGARAILCESDEKWHAERAKGIGSSAISAVCGKDKYRTILELWTEITGKSEGTKQNEYMYWGLELEPNVMREYTRRTGNKVFYRPRTLFVSKANPIFRVTPDGLFERVEGLGKRTCMSVQVKCTDNRRDWGEEGTETIPLHIYYAAQWEMGILGPEWMRCDLAVLFSGNEFKMYFAMRNEKIIKELQKRANNFWKRYVLTNKPPDMSEDVVEDSRVMAAAYPLEKEKIIKASDKTKEAVAELETLRVTIKESGEREERIKNEIRKAIGNNLGVLAELEGGEEITYRWTESKTSSFDKKQFKISHPDLHEKFVSRGITRSLRRYGGS